MWCLDGLMFDDWWLVVETELSMKKPALDGGRAPERGRVKCMAFDTLRIAWAAWQLETYT